MVTKASSGKARLAASRERFWQEQVRRQRRSGLSQAAFCRRSRLVPGTFAWWTRELRRRDQIRRAAKSGSAPAPRPAFLPVHVLPADRRLTNGALLLQVELANGRRIHGVGPGFDADVLRRLLALLEEDCQRPC